MGRDGICRVQGKTYSKCIRFYDINYQLAQNEDKNAIFENWCDFLNYFDSSIHFQLSFINHKSSMKEFEQVIRIRPQEDAFDDVRMEYAKMLKQQLAKGNNGLVKSKYITFSIEADNIREAKPKLERIESDILNNFKILGVPAYPLNGVERLQILYETFNPDIIQTNLSLGLFDFPLQYNHIQIYFLILVMQLVGIGFVESVTLLISALMHSSMSVLAVSLGVYILPLLLVQMIKTGVGNKILYLFPINNLNVQNILGILYSKDAFFFHSFFINIGFIFIFQLLIRVGMQLYCFIYIKHWKF